MRLERVVRQCREGEVSALACLPAEVLRAGERETKEVWGEHFNRRVEFFLGRFGGEGVQVAEIKEGETDEAKESVKAPDNHCRPYAIVGEARQRKLRCLDGRIGKELTLVRARESRHP